MTVNSQRRSFGRAFDALAGYFTKQVGNLHAANRHRYVSDRRAYRRCAPFPTTAATQAACRMRWRGASRSGRRERAQRASIEMPAIDPQPGDALFRDDDRLDHAGNREESRGQRIHVLTFNGADPQLLDAEPPGLAQSGRDQPSIRRTAPRMPRAPRARRRRRAASRR